MTDELSAWIVGYCEVPGCGVRIRYHLGHPGHPQCKWHQAGTAYNSPENKKKQPDTGHAA